MTTGAVTDTLYFMVPREFRAELQSIYSVIQSSGEGPVSALDLFKTFAASGIRYPGQTATGYAERQVAVGVEAMFGAGSVAGSLASGERELVIVQRQSGTRPIFLGNLKGNSYNIELQAGLALGGVVSDSSQIGINAQATVAAQQIELRDFAPFWFSDVESPLFLALFRARLGPPAKWQLKKDVYDNLQKWESLIPGLSAKLMTVSDLFTDSGFQRLLSLDSPSVEAPQLPSLLRDYAHSGFERLGTFLSDVLHGQPRSWLNPGAEQLIDAIEFCIASGQLNGQLEWLRWFEGRVYDLRSLQLRPFEAGSTLTIAQLTAELARLGYSAVAGPTPGNGQYVKNGSKFSVATLSSVNQGQPYPGILQLECASDVLKISFIEGTSSTELQTAWLFPQGFNNVSVIRPKSREARYLYLGSYLSLKGGSAGLSGAFSAAASTNLGQVAGAAGLGTSLKGTAYTLQTYSMGGAGVDQYAMTQETAITYLQAYSSIGGQNTNFNALRYRSAMACWGIPLFEVKNSPVVARRSGLSFGVSVPVKAWFDNDLTTLQACANAIHVTLDVLKDALTHATVSCRYVRNSADVTTISGLGVQTLLVESAWMVPDGLKVSFGNPSGPGSEKQIKIEPVLDQWTGNFRNFSLQAIYVRYRVTDSIAAAGDKFQLGTQLGLPGIYLQEASRAGYESTVELAWIPVASERRSAQRAEDWIAPVTLLCQ